MAVVPENWFDLVPQDLKDMCQAYWDTHVSTNKLLYAKEAELRNAVQAVKEAEKAESRALFRRAIAAITFKAALGQHNSVWEPAQRQLLLAQAEYDRTKRATVTARDNESQARIFCKQARDSHKDHISQNYWPMRVASKEYFELHWSHCAEVLLWNFSLKYEVKAAKEIHNG